MKPDDLTDLGGLLIFGGVICFLIWLFISLLWAIGLALVIAGIVLFVSGKMQSKK